MDAITYRRASARDAGAIGTMHVQSWRETYVGLLPATFLKGLSARSRSAMWKKMLDDPLAFDGTAVFVAESETAIVGFGACCEQRDQALSVQGFDGEVSAVYILRSHQGLGAGKALMGLMAGDLVSRGRRGASLWVLRENGPARAFYERLGGRLVSKRTDIVRGTERSEVAYGWSDLVSLGSSKA